MSQPVSRASNSAGPLTNDTPTASSKNAANTISTCRILLPRYVPTISGKSLPSLRSESIPEKKSCAAPIKMQPTTIHR